MDFLSTITPREAEAGRALSLATMALVISVGFVPPLRPYVYPIRVATCVGYILCVLSFIIYCAFFR
jgi:hypothetical protein